MERHIELDNTYMNVISFGKGSRVFSIIAGVSLTGLEGMGEALEQAFSDFVEDFTVYVFDRKKLLPEGYTIEDMADDIYRCLSVMGISKTIIYGASQGGMIGQVMAIKYSQLVEKLILCSTASRITPVLEKIIENWSVAAKEHDVRKLNQMFIEHVYSKEFIDRIKDQLPAILESGTAEDCERFHVMINAIKSFDVYDKLDQIKCPVLVLGDENDKVIGPKASHDIAGRLGCHIHMYDKYSHAVYDEAPDIKSRIKDFSLK